ncbi:MAG TPA: DUF2397 family protein [Actinomycetes bacterium]|jgi:hypothetical protein|nr:DUF2397 family protein [Actinomycetes bacterium]
MSEQPPAKPFAHLDAPNAELCRRVMGVFVAAKRRFLVHLRPEDLASSLEEADGAPAGLAAVEAALKQLEQWRNLRADPDTSRVTTVDDFHRPRPAAQAAGTPRRPHPPGPRGARPPALQPPPLRARRLALAALERADAQVTLGWLAERVLALTADPALADAGFSFALDSRWVSGCMSCCSPRWCYPTALATLRKESMKRPWSAPTAPQPRWPTAASGLWRTCARLRSGLPPPCAAGPRSAAGSTSSPPSETRPPSAGEAERAGLEAALESAGLLDAWAAPDGRLLDTGTYDGIVRTRSGR